MVQRILLGTAVLGSAVYFCLYNEQEFGYYISASNESGYRVSAGSSAPYAVGAIMLLLVYVIVLCVRPPSTREFKSASMWLRVAAFATDGWIAMLIVSGLGSLTAVVTESFRTGSFQWQFERRYATRSDLLLSAMIFVFMGLLVMYFILPLMKRRQTIGCWLFKLAVVGSGETLVRLPFRSAVRRVYGEFKGVLHPFRSFRERDPLGWTWYDRETGLTVMRY